MSRTTAVSAFQVTDLARRHREVLDEVRARGRALIRDKDGALLAVRPVGDDDRDRELLAIADGVLHLVMALGKDPHDRESALYGPFAWAAVLDEDDQRALLRELFEVTFVALNGGELEALRTVIGDWQATAAAWADPVIREALTADEPAPLYDVEL